MKPDYRGRFMLDVQDTLPEKARVRSIDLLNHHLAAAVDLRTQVKQAFWNLHEIRFSSVHFLLDHLAIEIEVYADLIAERTVRLGGSARGTLRDAMELSFLAAPRPCGATEASEHVVAFAQTTMAFGDEVREAIGILTAHGDIVTTGLFAQISRGLDRQISPMQSRAAQP